jgi:DhnA family fructose-bisphosphate aldolase class Ia
MNAYRLQRLFHPVSHRTLIVAIDHALFNNAAFLEGIEQMQKIVGKVARPTRTECYCLSARRITCSAFRAGENRG